MSRSKPFRFVILLFVASLTFACGGNATAPTEEQPELADLSGNYDVAGANPDGSTYQCVLDVARDGAVYQWNWSACGDFQGVGIQRENVVSVGWGGEECGVVSYLIQEDGALTGLWTTGGQTALGSEQATPVGDAGGDVVGTYSVVGANPDGSEYEGQLVVDAAGDVFRWTWDAGGNFLGVGIRQGNVVSVGWGDEKCGVASYLVQEDGTLDSRWVYVGQTDPGGERVTPAN